VEEISFRNSVIFYKDALKKIHSGVMASSLLSTGTLRSLSYMGIIARNDHSSGRFRRYRLTKNAIRILEEKGNI
jgi:hypothetical protein